MIGRNELRLQFYQREHLGCTESFLPVVGVSVVLTFESGDSCSSAARETVPPEYTFQIVFGGEVQ